MSVEIAKDGSVTTVTFDHPLIAISRNEQGPAPRGKPGVPKVGWGYYARATSATLQTANARGPAFLRNPGRLR